MPGYLLDTSVISMLAPGKPPFPPETVVWLHDKAGQMFLPCIAIAEIEQGIRKLRRSGGAARASALSEWLDRLLLNYGARILPLDAAAARLAGEISDQANAAGQHPGSADVAIAAIARQHGLVLLTRNIRHLVALGVEYLDPFVT